MPSACDLGGHTGNSARKHNIFPLLSDVANDPTGQGCNNVPFTRFATDLANGTLPMFENVGSVPFAKSVANRVKGTLLHPCPVGSFATSESSGKMLCLRAEFPVCPPRSQALGMCAGYGFQC